MHGPRRQGLGEFIPVSLAVLGGRWNLVGHPLQDLASRAHVDLVGLALWVPGFAGADGVRLIGRENGVEVDSSQRRRQPVLSLCPTPERCGGFLRLQQAILQPLPYLPIFGQTVAARLLQAGHPGEQRTACSLRPRVTGTGSAERTDRYREPDAPAVAGRELVEGCHV
jgi:hypothetical protein